MTVLAPPAGYDIRSSRRELSEAHPDLQVAWPSLKAELDMLGYPTMPIEIFRYDERQRYLFGGGRTIDECQGRGVPVGYARPHEMVVTNAWSAGTSAHGYTIKNSSGVVVPAAAAIDVVPVGKDGKPYTADDPWEDFLGKLEAIANRHGLRHFRNRFGRITDGPHLQLTSYSDLYHCVVASPLAPLDASSTRSA